MLKHPEITLRRIKLFLSELKGRVYSDRAPLQVEVNDEPAKTDSEARSGTWIPIEPGYKWGPAYTTRWFRVSGIVPPALAGKAVRAIPDVGGERTVWKDGSPVLGVDVEHTDFGVLGGGAVLLSDAPAEAGQPIEVLIQATARNFQARCHLVEPPRDPLPETYEKAELVAYDPALAALVYDVEFVLGLCEAQEPTSPERAVLLRALNDAANEFPRDGVEPCRQLLSQALDSLAGKVNHSITPMGHAHLDTAWLWPIEVTKLKMAHTTATQLALMERYPCYGYVHSQASQYEWLELEYPALFERVKEAIGKGQWEPVGSMWVEADCNLPGGESLVRQFLYGRRYFREKLGFETDDMFLPDVFGYSAALPQILAGFGIKYFLTQKISWNQFNKFPHNTFWWQGIDGTRVWSHFPPADTYVGNCEPAELLRSVKQHKDHGRSDESLYLFGFGDGGGGPTLRHLELLDRASKSPLMPKIELGKRTKAFYNDCYTNSQDLVTWTGELYLELHRGTYTSQAANKKANRECEFLLRDAELLAALSGEEYPRAALEEAWKLVLLNQFHDIIPGSSVREVYEDSAKDYDKVRGLVQPILEASLKGIAEQLEQPEGDSHYAVFHNAPSDRATAALDWGDEPPPVAMRSWLGPVPSQLVEAFGERSVIFPIYQNHGKVEVYATCDPPRVEPVHVSASERTLIHRDDGLRVEFDDAGCIRSIQLDPHGEFVAEGQRANVFQILEDKPLFWSAWDIDPYASETPRDILSLERFEVVENGPVRAAVEVERRFGASRIVQRISVGPSPGIRFDTWVDWHEEDTMLKVAFPLAINSSKATYEIQFGNVERPTHMNTTWDLARFEVCAQKWIALSEGGRGTALLNDGKYGHDVQDGVMRLTLLRSPKAPDPMCDMGEHRFSYVLLPHGAGENVVAEAYALNALPRVVALESGPKVKGKHAVNELGSIEPVSVAPTDSLIVESVKRAEDGEGLIVRLYECRNSRGTGSLRTSLPFRRAQRCNLEEVAQSELEVRRDGSVSFEYRPFEIVTLRLAT